jgi:hypothetical protein
MKLRFTVAEYTGHLKGQQGIRRRRLSAGDTYDCLKCNNILLTVLSLLCVCVCETWSFTL